MPKPFKTIAIVGKPRQSKAMQTHQELYIWLSEQGYHVLVDEELEKYLPKLPNDIFTDINSIGEQADLAIVVGGDGNMLGAARVLSHYDISVIGVNRGRLGFLTDLDPQDFKQSLLSVLQGDYLAEERFLLTAEIKRDGETLFTDCALNEVVLHPGKVAHMIEFEVYIDDGFAFSQRSDGLIVSTPTGSTAYSLSGGGPILSPSLNAISLVPMFPHTLSSRPLVVDANRQIKLILSSHNRGRQEVSCDGQVSLSASSKDEIYIYQSPQSLTLIHPKDYQYYHVLRTKLGWAN